VTFFFLMAITSFSVAIDEVASVAFVIVREVILCLHVLLAIPLIDKTHGASLALDWPFPMIECRHMLIASSRSDETSVTSVTIIASEVVRSVIHVLCTCSLASKCAITSVFVTLEAHDGTNFSERSTSKLVTQYQHPRMANGLVSGHHARPIAHPDV
jgi:hypothetical protein